LGTQTSSRAISPRMPISAASDSLSHRPTVSHPPARGQGALHALGVAGLLTRMGSVPKSGDMSSALGMLLGCGVSLRLPSSTRLVFRARQPCCRVGTPRHQDPQSPHGDASSHGTVERVIHGYMKGSWILGGRYATTAAETGPWGPRRFALRTNWGTCSPNVVLRGLSYALTL
jgi:hypothetical protein